MANYNNWTFAQSDWTATYNDSFLTLGLGEYTQYQAAYMANEVMYGFTQDIDGKNYVGLNMFGFG